MLFVVSGVLFILCLKTLPFVCWVGALPLSLMPPLLAGCTIGKTLLFVCWVGEKQAEPPPLLEFRPPK